MRLGQAWKVLVDSLKTGYERIGMIMLTNLLWFFIGLGPALVVIYLPWQHPLLLVFGILVTFFTLGGATAAVHYILNRIINREDVEIRDFKVGFRKFLGRGTILVFLIVLGFVILFVDLSFSLSHPNQIVQILSGIWVWAILYWFAVVQFVFPFLVQQDIGIIKLLKRSALITIDNVLGSLIIVIMAVIAIVLSTVLAAPILLFGTCWLALIQNYALNEMMLKYEESESEIVEE